MNLKNLEIKRNLWGDNKGLHTGVVSFDGELGEVSITLSKEMCDKIFEVCSEGILAVASEAAKELRCKVLDHKESLLLEGPSHE